MLNFYYVIPCSGDYRSIKYERMMKVEQELLNDMQDVNASLRSQLAAMTAERDRLRDVTKALVDAWAPDSDSGVDAVYRTWQDAYKVIYPNSTKKFGVSDAALESEDK